MFFSGSSSIFNASTIMAGLACLKAPRRAKSAGPPFWLWRGAWGDEATDDADLTN